MGNEMERIVMELVVSGGDARSKALEAVQTARKGEYDKAEQLMKECEAALNKAHEVQTDMIVREVNGEGQAVTLLMVHAQDHLMNAITVKDLAEQMIAMLKELKA